MFLAFRELKRSKLIYTLLSKKSKGHIAEKHIEPSVPLIDLAHSQEYMDR